MQCIILWSIVSIWLDSIFMVVDCQHETILNRAFVQNTAIPWVNVWVAAFVEIRQLLTMS
jgi:hypothetical protein